MPWTASSIHDGDILRPYQGGIGRRLVHPNLEISLSILSSHVPAGREVAGDGSHGPQRIHDPHPGVVKGGIL